MACNGHTALFKRIGSRDPNRYSYATVTAVLFTAAGVQTNEVFTNRWKDKPNTERTYDGTVLSRGKEKRSNTSHTVDAP